MLKFTLTATLALSLLTSCSKDSEGDKKGGDGGKKSSAFAQFFATPAATLKVQDIDGKPIANAQVLIGTAIGQPFADNFLAADANGVFIAPDAWKGAQMVTITAPNFVTTTYMQQTPHGQSFQIHATEASAKYEVTGQGTGFQTKDGDNIIDFAVVAPLMTRQSLLAFDLNMLISPQMDTISLYGQDLTIPSNVSLPKQKESYSFLPVTLNKPIFRMYFSSLGNHSVMAVRGQFPFKQVVKELQANKQFIELINYFSIQGGSIHDVSVTGDTQNQDLPVSELVFNQTRTFHAPAIDSSNVLLAVALSPYQDHFLITDVKNVDANTDMNMTTAPGADPQLLVVVQSRADDQQMTSALGTFTAREMLPMMEHPQVVSSDDIKIASVTAPTTIAPTATFAALSSVQSTKGKDGVSTTQTISHDWEVYSPSWETEIHLPQMPNSRMSDGQKRWEVSLMGSATGDAKTVDLGPRMLETATHATHSATTF